MTSATEVLRRMLDEREVEWHDTKIGKGFITVFEHDGITWIVTEHSSGRLSVKGCVKPTQSHYDGMTPEQAIAATLGSCNCSNNCTNSERTETCKRLFYEPTGVYVCSECGRGLSKKLDKYCYLHYCPNCGRKVVDE